MAEEQSKKKFSVGFVMDLNERTELLEVVKKQKLSPPSFVKWATWKLVRELKAEAQ